jgi:hypothetical protein
LAHLTLLGSSNVTVSDTVSQKPKKFKRGVIIICEICRRIPCDSRCPNAPEPPAIYECTSCHGEIRVGEWVVKLDGFPYCEECVENGRKEVSFDDYY